MKRKLLIFVFLFSYSVGFAQKNLLKIGGHPSIVNALSVMAELAYERVLGKHNSLQLAANAGIGPFFAHDAGPSLYQTNTIQYRYYFYRPKEEIQRAAYIAGGIRQNYAKSRGGYWDISTTNEWGIGAGFEIGKHLKLGKYGLANPYLGLYVNYMHFRHVHVAVNDGTGDYIYFNPPKITTGWYPMPTFRLGWNWGIAWGK
ncbi:MAG: hypothetical protein ACKVTZ_12070 [Bacteroidia bacterium]